MLVSTTLQREYERSESVNEITSSDTSDFMEGFVPLDAEEVKSKWKKFSNHYMGKLIVEILEIVYDFSETKQGRFEEPIVPFDRNEAKGVILDLIKANPNIMTSEILDMVDFDEWEILEILDELREEGKIE